MRHAMLNYIYVPYFEIKFYFIYENKTILKFINNKKSEAGAE